MSSRTYQLDEAVHQYLLATSVRENEAQRALRAATLALPNAGMQISPEQGQFMRLLVELLGVRRAIEVGTFTGYSALCVALALPPDGRLICCDVNAEWTAIARQHWRAAGVDDRIELRLGPAAATLDGLLAEGGPGTQDLVFLDADKTSYDGYYEQALRLLRVGGVVAVDNALWSGRVADRSVQDEDTRAIRALNAKVGADPRVTASLVPIGDGLLLARKRG